MLAECYKNVAKDSLFHSKDRKVLHSLHFIALLLCLF